MVKVILKYGLVGILNTIIDYTIFQIITFFIHNTSSEFIFFASFLSGSIAVVNSFIFNKKWTFKDKNDNYVGQFIKFTIINIFSISLNSFLVVFFTHFTPAYITILHHTFRNLVFTKAAAIIIVMFVNFFAYKIWVFEMHEHELHSINDNV